MAAPTFILKICGLTRLADLRTAEFCGATHIGLVVEVASSPRSLLRDHARVLARASQACAVMVTTSNDPNHITELALGVRPEVVQLHGGPPQVLAALKETLPGVQLWYAVTMQAGQSPNLEELLCRIHIAKAAGADALVLDAAVGGTPGGTGRTVDWQAASQLVREAVPTPTILAGGLNPNNVVEAVCQVRPAGVDVSSGVETAPNVKSPSLIRAFCQAVREITLQDRVESAEPRG